MMMVRILFCFGRVMQYFWGNIFSHAWRSVSCGTPPIRTPVRNFFHYIYIYIYIEPKVTTDCMAMAMMMAMMMMMISWQELQSQIAGYHPVPSPHRPSSRRRRQGETEDTYTEVHDTWPSQQLAVAGHMRGRGW